ncbi:MULTISPECIES: catalase HPII [Pseudomonas]|uniref:Catalase n=1 Tax=Pseudomonas putida TaxID=303 RepID=A0A7W2QL25_PSEPU|nr:MULTISPECIES: catalase HPII [Pseudomonas]MBA6118194.1 catalase HPII [Pseudomonas putida]MCZ9637864.1 catalase HPII [Pseudomonas putida]QNL85550.1 Catalase [Pseudomonas putida]
MPSKKTDTSKQSQLAGTTTPDRANTNAKVQSLEDVRSDATGQALRTNQGVRIADNQNTLKVGDRGPSLLEDFIMREKITHFDHERIPERIVHARGTGAHGFFQSYGNHAQLTKAGFLQDPEKITPVFVRFSTVQGPRGSGDTVRDVRGFAVKFYTDEGNFDLVGNNMPVFFIQDAIKFPDFVHAVKPEPHNEIPTGGSAHDTFWDFVSLVPESAHMVMWAMSDRAIPRSLRMMEGFGVHTFRLINAEGVASFVKFHWKPAQGVHSVLWDEAQKLAGKDTDFHRRDLWEAIETGDYPEWELGVQIVPEADEHKFDFDLLDPTKIIPEELVPVTPLGKMVLNRNPDNFFAEIEQIAFCPGHIVPGIDFSNDPLLQGRLFSYTDTQISRLGGPNFHEIPINRPVAPNHNNQRDALHRQTIHKGRASYEPNSIDGGWPKETPAGPVDGGFESYQERVDAHKVRQRSESFGDHFSQARMFFQSLSANEQQHVIKAYSFELGKVERESIRAREVNEILANIDLKLAAAVATNLGLPAPKAGTVKVKGSKQAQSPALSQMNHPGKVGVKGRKIAVLVANGVDGNSVDRLVKALEAHSTRILLLGPTSAPVKTAEGKPLPVDASMEGMPSIMFDGIVVPAGKGALDALAASGLAKHFLLEGYKHLKVIALANDGKGLLGALGLKEDKGLLLGDDQKTVDAFVKVLEGHRVWEREAVAEAIPA